MLRHAHTWTTLLISAALGGCATTRLVPPPPATGDASWRIAPAPGMTRYQLALGEVSSGAAPFLRVAPIYPPDLLATCPAPVDVEALLIVDQAGKVTEVRMVDAPQTDPDRRQFTGAVRVAARQWQFSPLQISHWAADADGNSHVVDSETKPFSLAYVFHFECHAGRSTVSSGAAKS